MCDLIKCFGPGRQVRVCPVDASAIGTLVARPIWEADGTLLLAVGETVTERMVRRLASRGIGFIEVTDAFLPELRPDGGITPQTRRSMHVALDAAFIQLRDSSRIDPEPLAIVVGRVTQEIDDQRGLLFSLSALKETDEGTLEHGVRVSILCALVALERGAHTGMGDRAALGGLLHDSGKAFLPREVLLNPGALDGTGWNTMRAHPVLGHKALLRAGVGPEIAEVALRHHERLDGSGYPDGLRDQAVPALARIAMVADMWDALVSERCYKPAWAPAEAAALLRKEAVEAKIDPEITSALLARLAFYPAGSLVQLGDGRLAQVVRQNDSDPQRPLVLVSTDRTGTPVHPFVARITERSVQVRRIVRDMPPELASHLSAHRDWVEEAVTAVEASDELNEPGA